MNTHTLGRNKLSFDPQLPKTLENSIQHMRSEAASHKVLTASNDGNPSNSQQSLPRTHHFTNELSLHHISTYFNEFSLTTARTSPVTSTITSPITNTTTPTLLHHHPHQPSLLRPPSQHHPLPAVNPTRTNTAQFPLSREQISLVCTSRPSPHES